MLKYVLLFASSCLASLFLTPVVRRLATWLGAVDRPDGERRIHDHPVPRLGGVAIHLAVLAAFAVALVSDRIVAQTIFGHERQIVSLAVGATLVMLLGAVDDFRSLSPVAKLLAQLVAGFVVVASGYHVQSLFGVSLGVADVPLTLLWVVAVTNAFNLIDGLDGLAAGVGVIVSATLAAVSIYSLDVAAGLILCAVGGALLGFLRYNFPPASIFLGDSGSLLLGFVFAVVSLGVSDRPTAVVAILVPILALGLPLMETALTVARRMLRGVRIARRDEGEQHYEFLSSGRGTLFTPDRKHIHHRLLDLGVTHRNAVLLLYGVAALFGASALALVLFRRPSASTSASCQQHVCGTSAWTQTEFSARKNIGRFSRKAERPLTSFLKQSLPNGLG